MSRNTDRREKYEAERLQHLASQNPEQFRREWERKLQAWAMEAASRGRAAAGGTTPAKDRERIFELLEKAERLLDLCGDQVRRVVVGETRLVLGNECCRIFSRLAGIQTYKLGNAESNYRLMKSGYRPPKR